jgi:anti-anti-sigma factor
MYNHGPVIIMELPELLKQPQVQSFVSDFQPLLEIDRPRVVLDCSKVQQIDSAGVEMLLHCLDEAMKRDGDLKLAAVSPASAIILELMRVDRLFEVFPSVDGAAASFHSFGAAEAPHARPWYSDAYRAVQLKPAS